ncbi:hypothetical protein [Roseiterribacter gracilis]|uniref:Uncharacterized protein n=1 Tax=Roseiterribacter gracilis TaxID=2812848 RepID=A0A8S8XJD8_9PROT|nr:hypothetical protein TMPK1_40640 [Rhodospirillales bacterium TMPK1]
MANENRDQQQQQGGQKDMKNQRPEQNKQPGKMDQSKTGQSQKKDDR